MIHSIVYFTIAGVAFYIHQKQKRKQSEGKKKEDEIAIGLAEAKVACLVPENVSDRLPVMVVVCPNGGFVSAPELPRRRSCHGNLSHKIAMKHPVLKSLNPGG